jgi:hypothetical protein
VANELQATPKPERTSGPTATATSSTKTSRRSFPVRQSRFGGGGQITDSCSEDAMG